MTGTNSGNGGERLDSWKAISTYLGRDEGTLRRWERTRGLPIRRVPGRKGASVYAFTAEIDAWLQADPPEVPESVDDAVVAEPATPPPTSSGAVRVSVGVMALAVLSLAGWWVTRPAAAAEDLRVELSESSVTARDARGKTLWVHQLGDGFRHIAADGTHPTRAVPGPRPRLYVATAIRYRRADDFVAGGRLLSLSLDGRPQWLFEFDDAMTVGGKPFTAPWGITAFAIDDSGGPRRIAVAAHHYTWSPSLVTLLDEDGTRVGTYANNGWIERLQWVAPNRLAIGGFHESLNGGMVALLDSESLDGQTPEDNPAHRCENCGTGNPLRVVVMPRTEVNLATESRFNRATLEHLGDRLLVRTVEVPASDQPPAEAIYEFTTNLDLVGASFSQRYWDVHDKLHTEKRLDHDRTRCADRDGPRLIHTWSSDRGWTPQAVR